MRKGSNTTILRLVGEVRRRHLACLLEPGVAMVGSLAECDVCVPDPSVSRRHARLRIQSDSVEVEDLGSTNGTRINGVTGGVGRIVPEPSSQPGW